MPHDDSWLGGENTSVPIINSARRNLQEQMIIDCEKIRNHPICRSSVRAADRKRDAQARLDEFNRVKDINLGLVPAAGSEGLLLGSHRSMRSSVAGSEAANMFAPPMFQRSSSMIMLERDDYSSLLPPAQTLPPVVEGKGALKKKATHSQSAAVLGRHF